MEAHTHQMQTEQKKQTNLDDEQGVKGCVTNDRSIANIKTTNTRHV